MSISDKPPILVFGFNRPSKLRECLIALEENEGAELFSLHIFIDGPRDSNDLESNKECFSVASAEWKFRDKNITTRSRNLGVADSIRSGLAKIFEDHESAIIIEDDLVLHSQFLNFAVEGLEKYRKNKQIASIQGFSLIEKQDSECYFLQGADCWGWATWKDRWEKVNWDSRELLNEIEVSGRAKSFNFENSYNFLRILKLTDVGKVDSWAILWQASMFLQNRVSVYPPFNLVLNHGFNESATHTKSRPQGLPEISTNNIWSFPDEAKVDSETYARVVDAYTQFIPKKHWMRKIKRLLWRIFS